jgi:hypothetical protein
MVCAEMVFALVVSKIFFSGIVLDVKLPGLNCISNPENFPLNLSVDIYRVICNARGGRIVAVNGCRRWVAKFFKGELKYCGLFAVLK